MPLTGPTSSSSTPTTGAGAICRATGIRQGKWKLELCADSGGWSTPKPGSREAKDLPNTQLYDLSADIAESKNLQAKYPEEVARLTKLLEQIIANGRSTPGAKQANDVSVELRKGGSTN